MSNQVRDEKDAVALFEDAFKKSEDFFSDIRKNYEDDNSFSHGDMWPTDVKNERAADSKRPMLVVNKIDPNVRRIVNEAKQQKLAINVKPVGDDGDPDVAEAHLHLIRDVEYQSNARFAYMWAFECAVRAGFGFFRVDTEYEDFDSFQQVARVRRIRNPLSVMWDPDSHEVDGSDARIVSIVDEISEAAAERLGVRPKDSLPQGERMKVWRNGDGIRVGELFWIEDVDDRLYQLADGKKFLGSSVDQMILANLKASGLIKADRKTCRPVAKWAKLCAGKLIQGEYSDQPIQELNTRFIPVVPIWGRESFVDGKLDFRGITRNSKDANRMYNYMSSKMVERIALAPIAPWVAAEGQTEPYQKFWKEANVKNIPVLLYKPKTLGGQLLPPPQRADHSSGDPTIERYMMVASEDVKTTSSLYDPSLGAQSNETSGKAILARQAQGNIATYDFIDNASMSLKHAGRILVDLHCHIIDTPYALRVLGEDGVAKVIKINQEFKDEKSGETKFLDLNTGKYGIEVDVGAGDQTRREQAVEKLSNIIGANPQAGALLMDVLVENMDIKNRDKVAKRFKATLPPEVIAAEEGEEKDNPELDAFEKHAEGIINELKAQLDEVSAKAKELEIAQKNKDGELQLKSRELDIKEQESRAKVELEIAKAEAQGLNAEKAEGSVVDALTQEIQATKQQVMHLIDAVNQLAEMALPPSGNEPATPDLPPPGPANDPGAGTMPDASAQSVGDPNVQ